MVLFIELRTIVSKNVSHNANHILSLGVYLGRRNYLMNFPGWWMVDQVSGLVLVAFESLPKLKPLINPHNGKVACALKVAHVESRMHCRPFCIIIFLSDDEFTLCYRCQKFGIHETEE